MLGWAAAFLVIALLAGLFGFSGLAVATAGVAQVIFWVFIALFVVAVAVRLIRGGPPV